MPKSKGYHGVKEVFIEADSREADDLWPRVDQALASGARVWLRSPLLASLLEPLGKRRADKTWLSLGTPAPAAAARWLRARDIIFSSLAMIVLSPLLLMLAVLVKLSSPGGVFYRTQVVGEGGRQFLWRKFRSMRVRVEEEDAAQRREAFRDYAQGRHNDGRNRPVKVIDQQRVTPLGRTIRKHSLDELPQLWNVFRGQMSLVGPRPCLPYETEFYQGWRQRRFLVPPGLTGVWQVFGRGWVCHDEAAAMDVFYFYRRSCRFDLYLLAKTVTIVFRPRGVV